VSYENLIIILLNSNTMDVLNRLRGERSKSSEAVDNKSIGDSRSTNSIVISNGATVEVDERSSYEDDDEVDARSILSDARSLRSVRSRQSVLPSNGDLRKSSDEIDHEKKSILKNPNVKPSYKLKNDIKSVLLMSGKPEIQDVNTRYNRTRRYDTAGKYRIGPTFITKARLSYLDAHKPAKLSVVPDPSFKSLEFGLLTYLWTFTDQHDKTEIDLAFLQSLINSGVDINCADEYGQTALHAMVRDWHPDVVLFAVKNNADVNAADKRGRSPLHLAAAINTVEIAKILCMHGGKIQVSYISFANFKKLYYLLLGRPLGIALKRRFEDVSFELVKGFKKQCYSGS